MHDPQTVAFEIPMFWRKKSEFGYRPSLITIWHVDPEKDGSDDSCDWFGRKMSAKEKALAARLIDDQYDNLRTFFSTYKAPPQCPLHADWSDCEDECQHGEFVESCEPDEMKSRLLCIFAAYKRHMFWRYPVRWHFWHWEFQIHPLQAFKRWAFSKCCKCGNGFKWGESPIGYSWGGTGPLWFRSERHIAHMACDGSGGPVQSAQTVVSAEGRDGQD